MRSIPLESMIFLLLRKPLTRFDLPHMQRLPLVPISVPPPGLPFRDAEVRIPRAGFPLRKYGILRSGFAALARQCVSVSSCGRARDREAVRAGDMGKGLALI